MARRRDVELGEQVLVVRGMSEDAHRLFAKLAPGNAARAHGATLDALGVLRLFPAHRPQHGILCDYEYERVDGYLFYRLRIADESYEHDDLCAFFVPFLKSPRERDMVHASVVVVLGCCWWSESHRRPSVDRIDRRCQRYVVQNR